MSNNRTDAMAYSESHEAPAPQRAQPGGARGTTPKVRVNPENPTRAGPVEIRTGPARVGFSDFTLPARPNVLVSLGLATLVSRVSVLPYMNLFLLSMRMH